MTTLKQACEDFRQSQSREFDRLESKWKLSPPECGFTIDPDLNIWVWRCHARQWLDASAHLLDRDTELELWDKWSQ